MNRPPFFVVVHRVHVLVGGAAAFLPASHGTKTHPDVETARSTAHPRPPCVTRAANPSERRRTRLPVGRRRSMTPTNDAAQRAGAYGGAGCDWPYL